VQPVVATPPPPAPRPAPIPPPKKEVNKSAPAKVIVQLPADATFYIDGQRSPIVSTMRTVVTPALPTGEDFYYTLRAEVVQNGQTHKADRRVLLRAGEIARVDFRDLLPEPAVAATSAQRRE
jgi:uncharacterized protein (TIGR03000 family)